MGGDAERVKERLDIAEVVSGYVKLDKAGASFKGRCPFHNEKTPSFFVSPLRQSYYCFGCGAKGDIFTLVQELDGLSFREALKSLAERAGVELTNRPVDMRARSEKETLLQALEVATQFFENELAKSEPAKSYVASRGITDSSVKKWRLGYAPAEWRALYTHMLSMGFKKDVLVKAGLIKSVADGSGKEPYDVFRDRVIFPLFDQQGEVIAFSGRALSKDAVPKYLNSPDTVLFTKSEVLYGLDKAKEKVRKVNFTVLVEGQVDLVLSHQAGVENTVASSGTAFTSQHLERLKRLSKRIILAFDGDAAGEKAGEKATELGLSLGLEVKVAQLPSGKDPAEIIKEGKEGWKEVLKRSLPAIEHFLHKALSEEKDARKRGLIVEKKILPLISLLGSAIERSHFISMVASLTGLKEDILWEDLKKVSKPTFRANEVVKESVPEKRQEKSAREAIEERLTEVRTWIAELKGDAREMREMQREEAEMVNRLALSSLKDELNSFRFTLSLAEKTKDQKQVESLSLEIYELLKKLRALEEGKDVL